MRLRNSFSVEYIKTLHLGSMKCAMLHAEPRGEALSTVLAVHAHAVHALTTQKIEILKIED